MVCECLCYMNQRKVRIRGLTQVVCECLCYRNQRKLRIRGLTQVVCEYLLQEPEEGENKRFDPSGYDKDLVENLERDIVQRNPNVHW